MSLVRGNRIDFAGILGTGGGIRIGRIRQGGWREGECMER